MFKIEYDDREREAVQYFDVLGGRRACQVTRMRLTTGDMAIWHDTTLLVLVERKSWNDLACSIKDGRLDAQLHGMNQVRAQTNCRVVLCVEGTLHKQHQHIEHTALTAKLDHIMLADLAHIIYTSSIQHTVQRIYDLMDHVHVPANPVFAETTKILTLPRVHTDEQLKLDMFCAITQVSRATAQLFINQHWSMLDLHAATTGELSVLVYESGTQMGTTRAGKIVAAMGTKNCWVRILASIPGVTKATAECIMQACADPQVWTIDVLAICKSKRVVGVALAKKIMRLV